MKIGLNATCFNNSSSGAKQRFVGINRELIKRMPNSEFFIYEPSDCNVGSWFDKPANLSVISTPFPSNGHMKKFLLGMRYWKPKLQRIAFDLFEGYNLPFFKVPIAKTIMTIHDVRGLNDEYSEYSGLQKSLYKKILTRSLVNVDQVITVSETIKKEILNYRPQCKVSVIYNGIDVKLFNQIKDYDLSKVNKKFNFPKKFILGVGHFEKRKNYIRLIEAFNILHKRGFDFSMILIGSNNKNTREIKDKIKSLKLSNHVEIFFGLSDFEVRCAYKLSSLFVFPSIYEGFGIPILEAMAANCPIVLSNIPVFREITENKGIYFDPKDTESIASEIGNACTKIDERKRLIDYGKKRVQDFSFYNMATQLESLYKSLIK